MKKIAILLICVITIASCSQPVNNSIVGKWTKDQMTLTVNDNNTQRGEYTIPSDPTHTPYDVTGSYTIHSDTFQFVNLAGTSSCPFGDTGTYTFIVNNNNLTLSIVSDQCSGRGVFMPGTYTRQ